LDDAAKVDPQLYFQERYHEVQRTLERLAVARGLPVPEQLGFPKEIPPSDTVPRLLVQLSLIEEVATLILEQGVTKLSSLRVEDPFIRTDPKEQTAFIMQLPIRVRLTAAVSKLMTILGALERAKPTIDVRSMRMISGTAGVVTAAATGDEGTEKEVSIADPTLDIELVLARYLTIASPLTFSDEAEDVP
jgi:hypothetical protein